MVKRKTATFYRNHSKVFETASIAVLDELEDKSKALPMRFTLSLSELQLGEYILQVSVLDLESQKVAFWQAPVMLVP